MNIATATLILLQGQKMYWTELHRESGSHLREMRLFQTQAQASSHCLPQEIITLENILEVVNHNDPHCCGFDIISAKNKYQFCADDQEEVNCWVTFLQQELYGAPLPGVTCMLAWTIYVNHIKI